MLLPFEETFKLEFVQLTAEQQDAVLQYVRSLKGTVQGTPGKDLMEFVGSISSADLELMKKAIEEGCEQVNTDAW